MREELHIFQAVLKHTHGMKRKFLDEIPEIFQNFLVEISGISFLRDFRTSLALPDRLKK